MSVGGEGNGSLFSVWHLSRHLFSSILNEPGGFLCRTESWCREGRPIGRNPPGGRPRAWSGLQIRLHYSVESTCSLPLTIQYKHLFDRRSLCELLLLWMNIPVYYTALGKVWFWSVSCHILWSDSSFISLISLHSFLLQLKIITLYVVM